MIEALNRVIRELRNTTVQSTSQFELEAPTYVARLMPLLQFIINTHPHSMVDYRRILEILNSAESIRNLTSLSGVPIYSVTPDNRESVLYHLTELYGILLNLAWLVNEQALEDLLNEIDSIEDQSHNSHTDGDNMDLD